MDLGLSGKAAWVLGASSGLGRATATSLAREGADVAISARGEEALAEAATQIAEETNVRCLPLPCDVTDPAAMAAAADHIGSELGGIDILVSNTGGPPAGGFEDFRFDDLKRAFELTTASGAREEVPA